MELVAYNELTMRTKPTTTIEESSEMYECYALSQFNILNTIITQKVPNAVYVHVESLWEPEHNTKVFNLMFFDDNEEIVGGCELTESKVFWDDINLE
jgi:hypothetical protein